MHSANMSRAVFDGLVADMYAAFNMQAPKSASTNIWFEQCAHVPAGPPLAWIRQQLLERDALPRNLGNAVKQLWQEWLLSHPDMVAHESARCPDCDEPGFVYTWRDGKRALAYCKCHPSGLGIGKRALWEGGALCMRSHERDTLGVMGYEQQVFGTAPSGEMTHIHEIIARAQAKQRAARGDGRVQ